MKILNQTQVERGYFTGIGGFPPAEILKEFKDYNGEEKICVACTQLDSHHAYLGRKQSEYKKILQEWIDFLSANTKAIKAGHFNSHVPPALFNAACCQENLEELRFKWGSYSDLSPLENLDKLKFLRIGSGAGVQDIVPLSKMNSLVVLGVQNFKRIEDYSPLTSLQNLEQLAIWGPILKKTPIKDLEFLRDMPNLRSISFGVTIRRKYTRKELADLRAALPNLYDISDVFKVKQTTKET